MTTALCSPMRAALLPPAATITRRHRLNHRDRHRLPRLHRHRAKTTAGLPEVLLPTAGLPEVLELNDYATAVLGTWGGPFDGWPTGRTRGFENFYVFMQGETPCGASCPRCQCKRCAEPPGAGPAPVSCHQATFE